MDEVNLEKRKSVSIKCCENVPVIEIEYEIGTTYKVCLDCIEKPYFARGIKSKKEIENTSTQTQSRQKTKKSITESRSAST